MKEAKKSQNANADQDANEGEGSRTAANRYNEKTRDFARSGQVDRQAKDAKRAVEGEQRSDLHKAEDAGRAHAKDEDPYVSRPHKGR
jgi:hypothetical protein